VAEVVEEAREARGKANIATTNPDQKLETFLRITVIFDVT
jgi:hypothetical protein